MAETLSRTVDSGRLANRSGAASDTYGADLVFLPDLVNGAALNFEMVRRIIGQSKCVWRNQPLCDFLAKGVRDAFGHRSTCLTPTCATLYFDLIELNAVP